MHLVPTLNRITKLTAFMESARATGTSTPGLVIVDEVDFLDNLAAYTHLQATAFPQNWHLKITKARGMGDKIREAWPFVRHCDWVSLENDDHYFITPQWYVKLIRQLTGKNVVSCNDRLNCPPRMGGVTLFSMPLLECLGWPIFPVEINHLGIDDVWERLGRAAGCWTVDPEIIVEHRHVFRGAEKDETHKLTYGPDAWVSSPQHLECAARLQLFMEIEFDKAVEKIKALKAS
jgi:hypothetical protein